MAALSWIVMGLVICWLDQWIGKRFANVLADGRPEVDVDLARRKLVERYVLLGASGFAGGWALTLVGIGDLHSIGCSNLLNLVAAAFSAVFLRVLLKGLGLGIALAMSEDGGFLTDGPRVPQGPPPRAPKQPKASPDLPPLPNTANASAGKRGDELAESEGEGAAVGSQPDSE